MQSAGAEDRLIFTGGSDGNDLVRNGSELREVSSCRCGISGQSDCQEGDLPGIDNFYILCFTFLEL